MPKDVLIRVPTNLVGPWKQIRQEIEARISERLRIPMQEVTMAYVFGEVTEILGEYIFVAGYPRPGDASKKIQQANAKHRELVEAVEYANAKDRELVKADETIKALEDKIASLEAAPRSQAD